MDAAGRQHPVDPQHLDSCFLDPLAVPQHDLLAELNQAEQWQAQLQLFCAGGVGSTGRSAAGWAGRPLFFAVVAGGTGLWAPAGREGGTLPPATGAAEACHVTLNCLPCLAATRTPIPPSLPPSHHTHTPHPPTPSSNAAYLGVHAREVLLAEADRLGFTLLGAPTAVATADAAAGAQQAEQRAEQQAQQAQQRWRQFRIGSSREIRSKQAFVELLEQMRAEVAAAAGAA